MRIARVIVWIVIKKLDGCTRFVRAVLRGIIFIRDNVWKAVNLDFLQMFIRVTYVLIIVWTVYLKKFADNATRHFLSTKFHYKKTKLIVKINAQMVTTEIQIQGIASFARAHAFSVNKKQINAHIVLVDIIYNNQIIHGNFVN